MGERAVYHRRASPTQTAQVAAQQEETGEVWGRIDRYDQLPHVRAYRGPLPPDTDGVEFSTMVPPDRGGSPGIATWTGPREGVIVDDDVVRIRIQVTMRRYRA